MGSRTIVVGDIHGCYDELEDLLAEVEFGKSDRLVSVGDLITKGPKNRKCWIDSWLIRSFRQ
jgi:hypothetical protein